MNERLFIGFDSPPTIKQYASDLQQRLREAKADVSWEGPEKLHCTVKFLGDTPQERVEPLIGALELIGRSTPPFAVEYGGVGFFPDSRSPRVAWIGIREERGILNELAATVDRAAGALGFPREQRAFHAHLTIGRIRSRHNLGQLTAILETITLVYTEVVISEIALIRSELRPSGSVYTPKKVIPLVANPGQNQYKP